IGQQHGGQAEDNPGPSHWRNRKLPHSQRCDSRPILDARVPLLRVSLKPPKQSTSCCPRIAAVSETIRGELCHCRVPWCDPPSNFLACPLAALEQHDPCRCHCAFRNHNRQECPLR